MTTKNLDVYPTAAVEMTVTYQPIEVTHLADHMIQEKGQAEGETSGASHSRTH